MNDGLWVADHPTQPDVPDGLSHGQYWSNEGGDNTYPDVTRPIGFMRSKPRVRVKAWTMPIIPKGFT